MEIIVAILAIVGGFAALDALALHLGADTSNGVAHGHARSGVRGRP